MESNKEFNALLQVLAGEQQVIQRTDQKAFTLLSILGVFMVFFIVHFPKIQMNFFIFLMMMVYFTSAMGTIYYLVRVIVPRIRKRKKQELNGDLELTFIDKMTSWISNYKIHNDYEDIEKDEVINPTFFAGISRFKSSSEYAVYLKSIAEKAKERILKSRPPLLFESSKIQSLKTGNI